MADKKISQLTSASTPLTGSEELAIVQSGATVKATAQDIADLAGAPYLVYTALLTQSGIDAPVATVLQNTLGGTPVWARTGNGTFSITLANAFPVGKTVMFLTIHNNDGNARVLLDMSYAGAPNANVRAFRSALSTTSVPTDGLAALSCIEIRVYP
jgi:hypothetical protein